MSILQGFKIRELIRVINEEKCTAKQKEKNRKDKGVDDVKGQSPSGSLSGWTILFFHRRMKVTTESKKGKPLPGSSLFIFQFA